MNAESGACADKKRIATRAKALNLDAIHEDVYKRQMRYNASWLCFPDGK